jgi:glycosyltransferase involved in cell wall biosynthesis
MRYEPGLVSIITPCYNAARFVAETIESVAAQTYPLVEHIVVDDGSIDDSWAVIESFGGRINAVRLEHNRGGSYARNRGAALARGEYLMFLDADDVLIPRSIASLVTAVRHSDRTAAVCPWHRLNLIDGFWQILPSEIPFPPPQDSLKGWLEGVWVPPCAVLWRRDAYNLTGGWDEKLTLNDDGDLMMRALVEGVRLVVAKEGEALYRGHPPSRVTVSGGVFSESKLRSQIRIFERLEARLDGLGRLPDYEVALGIAYQRWALTSFQAGHWEIAREFLKRGEHYAGRQALSPTLLGRFLTVLVGLEWKERIAAGLAHLGIMSAGRRRGRQRRLLYVQLATLGTGGKKGTGGSQDETSRREIPNAS